VEITLIIIGWFKSSTKNRTNHWYLPWP